MSSGFLLERMRAHLLIESMKKERFLGLRMRKPLIHFVKVQMIPKIARKIRCGQLCIRILAIRETLTKDKDLIILLNVFFL